MFSDFFGGAGGPFLEPLHLAAIIAVLHAVKEFVAGHLLDALGIGKTAIIDVEIVATGGCRTIATGIIADLYHELIGKGRGPKAQGSRVPIPILLRDISNLGSLRQGCVAVIVAHAKGGAVNDIRQAGRTSGTSNLRQRFRHGRGRGCGSRRGKDRRRQLRNQ